MIEIVESSKKNQQIMADATGDGKYSWSASGRVEVISRSNKKNTSNEKGLVYLKLINKNYVLVCSLSLVKVEKPKNLVL